MLIDVNCRLKYKMTTTIAVFDTTNCDVAVNISYFCPQFTKMSIHIGFRYLGKLLILALPSVCTSHFFIKDVCTIVIEAFHLHDDLKHCLKEIIAILILFRIFPSLHLTCLNILNYRGTLQFSLTKTLSGGEIS